MLNYRSPGEIARAQAEAAGRPDDWQDFLPLEDGSVPEVQPRGQASRPPLPAADASGAEPPRAAWGQPGSDAPVVMPPAEDSDRPAKDAKRLYNVAEAIYTMLIIFNWVIGIGGGLMALGWFIGATTERREPAVWVYAGVVTLLITGIICLFNYAVAVLSTHVAKVLSNISLSLVDKQ
jgi:hypothetical protein